MGEICPVNVERPTKDGRYWHIILNGLVIALCPSEATAIKVGAALLKQCYEDRPDAVDKL